MINEINVKNPKRFYRIHLNPTKNIQSKRFDFKLIQTLLAHSYYLSSMFFVISSIVIYLIINIWPFDIKTTMGIFGFNILVILIHVIEDIYNYIQDECE